MFNSNISAYFLAVSLVFVQSVVGVSAQQAVTIRDEVASWGYGGDGQLGNNSTEATQITPVPVEGLDQDIALGSSLTSTYAIKEDGTLWAWGGNYYGEFGNGMTDQSLLPIQVGTDSDWVEVDGGDTYVLARKSDGSVWTAGEYNPAYAVNSDGPATLTPIASLSNITDISAGYYHALALDSDGNVWSWGVGDNGELGDGVDTFHVVETPAPIANFTGATSVCAGYDISGAIQNDGSVWLWGQYDGANPIGSVPTLVEGIGGAEQLECDYLNAMALTTDGSVWAWGTSFSGDGSAEFSTVPRRAVSPEGERIVDIANGGFDSFYAVSDAGSLYAWGQNTNGVLGLGFNNETRDGFDDVLVPTLNPALSSVSLVEGFEAGGVAIYDRYATVEGRVYEDVNQNQVFEAADRGLVGVTLELTRGDELVQAQVTDEEGRYTFANLISGTYFLRATNLEARYPDLRVSEEGVREVSVEAVPGQTFEFPIGMVQAQEEVVSDPSAEDMDAPLDTPATEDSGDGEDGGSETTGMPALIRTGGRDN